MPNLACIPTDVMPPQFRILQVNLNRSSAAQDLLVREIAQEDINIAIIAEYHRCRQGWVKDTGGGAAIWMRPDLPATRKGPTGNKFASMISHNTLVVSVYLPPNDPYESFYEAVEEIYNSRRLQCQIPDMGMCGQ